jgi:tetratricopeptide (TPR) repeat protein
MAGTRRKGSSKRASIVSGAVGGPSTGAGLNYQINYALLRLLQIFPEVLSFPARNPAIRLEPRELDGATVTRWDAGFENPREVAEVKLNPTMEDLDQWVERSRAHGGHDGGKFVLVYSKGSVRRLVALNHLIRVAHESGSDAAKFKALIELEDIRDADAFLSNLGPEPQTLLAKMKLLHLPDQVLDGQIDFCCAVLAGQEYGRRLRDMLFARIAEAIPLRATLPVRDLIKTAIDDGIHLNSTPEVDVPGLPDEIRDAVLLLNKCPVSVPVEILANAVGSTTEALSGLLEHARGAVLAGEGEWKLAPLPVALPHAPGDLCARGLKAVLSFIDKNRYHDKGRNQVHNAIALARICAHVHPESVARVFITIDKPLKAWGDKHLVLDVAELVIGCARRVPSRGRAEVEGEAQAMICGKSWALQRIGRLDEARIAAEKSLKLGEDIGWDRNTAYCEKCVGRLYRIMAEEASDPEKKRELLDSSRTRLETAIARFSLSPEFGPSHPEIGDCYSLLGRTYLVAQNIKSAWECVGKAGRLLSQNDGKDYLDLRILEGELLERRDREAAESCYSDVLKHEFVGDAERSEIAARAYLRRAKNRTAMGKDELAARDFSKAEELWTRLGEPVNAAVAAWDRLKMQKALPASALGLLLKEQSLPVRVEVIREHQRRLEPFSGKRIARRSEPGVEYWQQLIKLAREKVAVQDTQW